MTRLRPQYHFRREGGHLLTWDVRALVRAAKPLPVEHLPLTEIAEIHECFWYKKGDAAPTCRSVLTRIAQLGYWLGSMYYLNYQTIIAMRTE